LIEDRGFGRWVELGGVAPRPRWSARMVAAAGIVVLMIGVLSLKLTQLQMFDASTLAGLARSNTIHRVVIEADRGIIYDRHGVPLVQNTPIWNLQVVPADLPADFPIYPGARVAQSFRGGASPAARGVGWESTDPPNRVYDFYRNALKQRPWRVLAAVPYPVGTISFLHESHPVLSCSLVVGKTKRGTTLVIFQYAPT